MKLFNEYTVRELSKLSYIQIEDLIKLECSVRKVHYLGSTELKEPKPEDFADDFYFYIENTSIRSRDRELLHVIAESLQDSTHSFQDTNWSLDVGYDFPYLETEYSPNNYQVRMKKCFKKETVLNHGPAICAYKESHKAYLKKLADRKESAPAYLEIRKAILSAYEEATRKTARANELTTLFNVFKKLASTEDEARTHFEKYYPGEFETIKGDEAHGREENTI